MQRCLDLIELLSRKVSIITYHVTICQWGASLWTFSLLLFVSGGSWGDRLRCYCHRCARTDVFLSCAPFRKRWSLDHSLYPPTEGRPPHSLDLPSPPQYSLHYTLTTLHTTHSLHTIHSLHTVYTLYTHYTMHTHYTLHNAYTLWTHYTVYTLYTLYTNYILTAHCILTIYSLHNTTTL